MDTIATEEWAWMMRRSVAHLRVGITPPPGQDGRTIDDQVPGTDEPTADGNLYCQDE
jgi:hypothetical protein